MGQTGQALAAGIALDRGIDGAPVAPGRGVATRITALHVVPAFLVLAFFVPIQVEVGGLRLSLYRVVLLLAVLPMLARLAALEHFRLRLPDILLIAAAASGGLSLVVTGSSIPTVGIFLLETTVPYFIARAYLRDAAAFGAMARLFSGVVIATMPFAIYESLTGVPILLRGLGAVFTVLPEVPHEVRLGLERAQLTFDHPILYGMVAAMAVPITVYTARLNRDGRMAWIRAGLVSGAVFFSLSAGAWVAVGLQVGLIAYDRILRGWSARWRVFVWGSVTLYVVLEVLSNRSMPEIVVNYLSLNPGTGWTRIVVNDWAWGAVMTYPVFGLGFDWSWPRPFWVPTSSIDNFWLALAFRHGLPLMLLMLAAVASLLYLMARARSDGDDFDRCRTALIITIVAMSIAVYTVHLWNAAYCMFLFLLGCGGWIIDRGAASAAAAEKDPEASQAGPARGGPGVGAAAVPLAAGEGARRQTPFSRFKVSEGRLSAAQALPPDASRAAPAPEDVPAVTPFTRAAGGQAPDWRRAARNGSGGPSRPPFRRD